jgi:hypothetical protein
MTAMITCLRPTAWASRSAIRYRGMKLVAYALLATASGLPLAVHASPSEAGTRVEAVWKAHSVSFIFRGDHSCMGLQQKLRRLLQSVGARSTLSVQTDACEARDGIVRVRLTFESPAQAGDREAPLSSRERLIARVRGEQTSAVVRFTAVWKSVSFRDRKLGLTHGDCPLLEHVRDFVLPELSVHVVRDELRCWSQFSRAPAPSLAVLALVPDPENG